MPGERKMARRWWAVKVNGTIESVDYGSREEIEKNADISGLVEFGDFKLPITIEIVPVTVTEATADKEGE